MQSKLSNASERARDLSNTSARLEADHAQQRSAAQQAQHDAGHLQGEVKSLAETLAQRDSDLQVRSRSPASYLTCVSCEGQTSVRTGSAEEHSRFCVKDLLYLSPGVSHGGRKLCLLAGMPFGGLCVYICVIAML